MNALVKFKRLIARTIARSFGHASLVKNTSRVPLIKTSRAALYQTILSVFVNPDSGAFDRLESTSTYKNCARYRDALKGMPESAIGESLSTRASLSSSFRSSISVHKNKSEIVNILFATRSWHFAEPLVEALAGNRKFNISAYDLNEFDVLYHADKSGKFVNKVRFFREEAVDAVFAGDASLAPPDFQRLEKIPQADLNSIHQADIVFVDWLNHNTLWATTRLPPHLRLVVRVHSYECFSIYPSLLDFGRIDALVFISEGIKSAFFELWGWLVPNTVRAVVIENVRSSSRLSLVPRTPSVELTDRIKTLGMLQYNGAVKDLAFALDVMEHLWKYYPDYKLLLGGNRLNPKIAAERALSERIQTFPTGAVQELGYLQDVGAFFNRIGYTLSTSIREGSHETLIEGMKFGCVPVIRNWPLLKPFEGARNSFPTEPNHDTPQQMAEYIFETGKDFANHCEETTENASRYFDTETVVDKYAQLFEEILEVQK